MRYLIGPVLAGIFVSLVGIPLAQALPADQIPDRFPYIWVQYGKPDNSSGTRKRIARVILRQGADCPTISENGLPVAMQPRALSPKQNNGAFPVTVCSATLQPSSVAQVTVTEKNIATIHALPTLPSKANTVVVFGDTGCRLGKWGPPYQDCDNVMPTDPRSGWPLEKIAEKIAARKPDAIIHMGDYHYREANPCPAFDQGTCGDTWVSWKADWFNPARSALTVAPWVMVRGNHEYCARSWRGFTLFLSVDPVEGTQAAMESSSGCTDLMPSYTVELDDDISLAVVDTANQGKSIEKSSVKYCPTWADGVRKILDAASSDPASHWLTLHHPIYEWTVYPIKPSENACVGQTFTGQNYTQGLISGNAEAGKAAPGLILSGHAHMWQWNRPLDGNLPLQMVVGHGGTSLDETKYYDLGINTYIGNTESSTVYPGTPSGAAARTKAGLKSDTTGWTNMDIIFGYQIMKRLQVPTGTPSAIWRIEMVDINDALLRVCMAGAGSAAAAAVANSAGIPSAAGDIAATGCHVVSQNGK